MSVSLTNEMIAGAKQTELKYGVPASVTLGQIMLESGGNYEGGLSGLAYNYNNLFGVTAGSSYTGKTVVMSNKNGTDTKTYRVYDSVSDSIEDHAKVLQNDRYTQYTSKASSINEYVEGVSKGGYAEDPNYAKKLMSVIESNNLTQYDSGNWLSYTGSESGTTETDLKWWGDIVVVVLVVLLIGAALLFFMSAFSNMTAPTPVKQAEKIMTKVRKKSVKTESEE